MTPEPQAEPLVKIGPATGATSQVAQQGNEHLAEPEATNQPLIKADEPANQRTGADEPATINVVGPQDYQYGVAESSPTQLNAKKPVSQPPAIQAPASGEDGEPLQPRTPEIAVMTVVEHLDELRQRLIRCVVYIVGSFVVALFVTKDILRLLEKPAGSIQFQALSLEEPVLVFFKVAFYAGVALASPLVLFEISRFVAPGLTKRERRLLMPIVIGSPLLFLGGVTFAYVCLLPPMLHFFQAFGAGVTPINQRLDFYISLVSSILLYLGLSFQLPIIIFCLSFTGLINSQHLIRLWKYALILIAMVAAVVTPDPTAVSMILVMLALMTLYALSYVLLRVKETFWSSPTS